MVTMEQWYCLHTKPNAEYRASASLEWRGLETYLPLVTSARSKRAAKQPLFPCYLFLRIDPNKVNNSIIQWTPGLRRIVSFNNKPALLSDELISGIQSLVERLEHSGGIPCHNFSQGDRVRIINGPLDGLEAIFDEPENATRRVHVLLKFLGQMKRVTTDVDDIEKNFEVTVNQSKHPRRTRGKGRRINAVSLEGNNATY